ncbi:MAG TPA: MFS transporter [Chloroflexota bacterium]|nr:MFS transporter [Chloroflexota bacterium]
MSNDDSAAETGNGQRTLYTFGALGWGAYNGFNNAILSLVVHGLTHNPFIIGYLSNTRTIEGFVIQPLVGRWSDRTSSALGRRRPFMLIGIPITAFLLLLMPVIRGTGGSLTLLFLAVDIILFSIAWNVALDPYQAMMIDITPPRRRSIFNAIISIVSLLGQVAIVAYASIAALKKHGIPSLVFVAAAAIIFLSFAVVFFGVREPRTAQVTARVEESIPPRRYLAEMRTFTEAFKLLVSVFFLWTGLNAILPFITIFPGQIVHASASQSLLIYIVIVLSSAVFAYPFGRLARRFGNRRLIVVGTLLLIAAAIWGLVVPTYVLLFPLAILAGCGFAATTVLTYPYLSELVPPGRIGVFTGLQTAFSSVAVPVSVVFTGLLIDQFGYRSIFAMLAIMMVFDIAVLLTVNEERAHEQIRRVEVEENIQRPATTPTP